MADGSHTTLGASPSSSSPAPLPISGPGLVAGLRSFASGHGGATAVIEYVPRRGARIVLAGNDGTSVDHPVEDTETARAACAKAGVEIENGWERELVEQMRPSNDLWRSMGRRVLSR